MKKLTTLSILLILLAFVVPVQASAATSAGVKPGSFFYFFDTTFENVSLFFTFDSENKAKKALGYADERLAEIEAIAEEKNPNAVKTAITSYESNMALATEKSKDIKDKGQAESLLTLIEDNFSKNQEVLAAVLIKVPEEAREAITQAIEASRKGKRKRQKQIADLKGEVEQLKQEVANLKTKDEEKGKIIEELGKQKSETTSKPTPVSASIKPNNPKTSEATPAPKPATAPSQTQTQTSEPQSTQSTVQPPSNTTNIAPTPTTQAQTSTTIQISSVNVTPLLSTAQIEWQTSVPSTGKVFVSGGNLSSKVFYSDSNSSTRHVANITGLSSNTNYSYEIESITGEQVVKKEGSFITKKGELSVQSNKTSIQLTTWNSVDVTAQYTENGKPVPVEIAFSAAGSSKTYKVIQNWPQCGSVPFLIQLAGTSGGSCSSDGKVNFNFQPKSLGTHTISISANGVDKTVNVEVIPHIKIDPEIRDVLNSDRVFEINSTAENSIGSFKFSQADEPIKFETYDYKYESGIQEKGFLRIIQAGEGYQLRVIPKTNTYALAPGIHTVKITEIKVVGVSSGNYRYVSGLPVTFTFEIKDIPNPEIIPIKTTHTYTGGRHPGVIGLFQIKMRPNSSIKLLCDNIRMINGGDSYSAYIYKETVSGRVPQCPTSWFGGESNIVEVSTDSNGVSTLQYSLWIQDLTPPSNKMEFRIEGMKVKDMTTGIVRDVLSPPIFNLEIVN